MMKKVLCLALVGSLMCAVGANAQTTVDLELVSDSSNAYRIEATITGGDLSEGLALWGADVNFTAGGPPGQMSCPVAMSSFQVNDGLNNPAGYGGTLSGNILLQVGGAQNTINNDVGNAPYPIGAVVTGIGDTTITVAEGTCVDTVDTMTLENGFANVINDGELGPVYAVSAATVTLVGTDVICGGGGGAPNLVGAASVGFHAAADDGIGPAWPGGEVELPISLTDGLIEPRDQGAAGGNIWLVLDFDGTVDAGSLTADITPAPGATWSFAAGASSTEAELYFTGVVAKGAYTVTLTAGGVGSFPLCFVNGDSNCDGWATGLDMAVMKNGLNWQLDLGSANEVRADVNLDGIVTGLDMARVKNGLNWQLPNPALTECQPCP